MIMNDRSAFGPSLGGLVFLAALTAAAPVRAPQVRALQPVESGQWILREPGATSGGRVMCLSDVAALWQLADNSQQCTHVIIADQPDSATVHYTCAAGGHGRTTISVETPRLFQLHTQGIANGGPFDLSYEGRRVGACPVRGH
jgi:hypothetical protein